MFRSNSPFGNDTSSYAGSIQSNLLAKEGVCESVNKMMDKLRYRVEHLFTCDLDGKELRGVGDCVERLKILDGMGRVWGQNMRLEVRGANLLLTDRETKEELESMSFSDILELKAVLDAGVFNSLLTVSFRPEGKHTTTVFMFQCEDVRADYVQRDLSAALSRRKHDLGISSNAGPIARHQEWKTLVTAKISLNQKSRSPPNGRLLTMRRMTYLSLNQLERAPSPQPSTIEEEPLSSQRPYTDLDRNVDILNHILGDIEIFMGKVAAVTVCHLQQSLKTVSIRSNVVSTWWGSSMEGLTIPALLNLFTPYFHINIPGISLEEASTEEDQLWQSLGDAWNIPSTQWPEDDEDIPTYTLEFSDGWQAPEVTAAPKPSEPMRREERQQPAPYQAPAKSITPAHRPKKSSRFVQSPPRDMYVTYDFISRNQRELTVRKGEVVQLLDMSKQWWKVRDSAGEEGYVPNNVLEVYDEQQMEQAPEGPPVLTKKSKPAEVKAWLEDKGFGKITVRCLGGLSGSMLLGMSREELKTVCPEEGGRVFFQLQAVKSAMSVAT
ncbi:Epidermal growth factor receptor kinase substrate 8-like protein 3 [Dissostichus eleginoides]|uniref:Epidermal growth factor receptor kinase substrate 8-like protein 3 n=1 Tax=Dissostichus eleginoides TaxID=100907 RepID=A0AAD9CGI7_DISEL|nr:Epidermal growth factor receptor kinase substrate 8-like protein 3 [Dissostichus eleginoides]